MENQDEKGRQRLERLLLAGAPERQPTYLLAAQAGGEVHLVS